MRAPAISVVSQARDLRDIVKLNRHTVGNLTLLQQCTHENFSHRTKGARMFAEGFPGKESTCQRRRHGFDPWSRKIPRASEQLSPCAASTEACAPRACAPQEKPLARETRGQSLRKSPHSNKDRHNTAKSR